MTEMGHVWAYFSSDEEVLKACDEWYKLNDAEKKQEVTIHNLKPDMNYESIAMM